VSHVIADTASLTRRRLIHLRKDKMALSLGIIQPLILLTLVGPLLDHVVSDAAQAAELKELMVERFETTDYLSFLFSGIAVFTILVNSILGGIPVVFDRETGFMDKILAAPVSRLAIVASRFLYVVFYSLLQVGVISVVAVAIGVRPEQPLLALGAVVGYGALLAAGITVLSLALAFVWAQLDVRGADSAAAAAEVDAVLEQAREAIEDARPREALALLRHAIRRTPPGEPGRASLLVLSPTFVARETMPGWMAAVAAFNPMTHAIEPIRSAFLGTDATWLYSAGWLLAFDALCFAFAVGVIRKRLD